jgi:hypothetical protein
LEEFHCDVCYWSIKLWEQRRPVWKDFFWQSGFMKAITELGNCLRGQSLTVVADMLHFSSYRVPLAIAWEHQPRITQTVDGCPSWRQTV